MGTPRPQSTVSLPRPWQRQGKAVPQRLSIFCAWFVCRRHFHKSQSRLTRAARWLLKQLNLKRSSLILERFRQEKNLDLGPFCSAPTGCCCCCLFLDVVVVVVVVVVCCTLPLLCFFLDSICLRGKDLSLNNFGNVLSCPTRYHHPSFDIGSKGPRDSRIRVLALN